MANNRRTLYLSLIASLTLSTASEAAEWVAEPSISARTEYNDNFRLTTTNEDSVWGVILTPRLGLARRSELGDLTATGRLRISQYPDEDNLDTVDRFFDIGGTRRFERGSLGAAASWTRDTTLQNEFIDVDTGVTINQVDRSRLGLRVSGQYLFTEATWLQAAVSYSSTDYDDGAQRGLLDYEFLTPSLQLVHQINPKTQVFAIYSHVDVDYDASFDLTSKTDSLKLGANYDITETWKLSGAVGSRRTRTNSVDREEVPVPGLELFFPLIYNVALVPVETKTTGIVFDASLTREFETGSIQLSGSRSITPSSTGRDTEATQISLVGEHRFTTQLSSRLAVSYYQSSSVSGVTSRADIDRYRIAPSLTWRLSEEMRLNAGYAYTRVDRDASDREADNNLVFVSIGYEWPRIAISR